MLLEDETAARRNMYPEIIAHTRAGNQVTIVKFNINARGLGLETMMMTINDARIPNTTSRNHCMQDDFVRSD